MQHPKTARALIGALVLSLVLASTAMATTFDSGETVLVEAGETVEGNLYAFGNEVIIRGTVAGDLIGGATRLVLEEGGVVEGDLMAGAQSVQIDGTVEGDTRAAGFMVQVGPTGQIDGEFLAAGYSVGLAEGGVVGGDAVWTGQQGLMDGTVEGDLHFAGGGLDLQGTVAGDVDAAVAGANEVAPPPFWMAFMPEAPTLPRTASSGLNLGDEAQIGGQLTYHSPEHASGLRESAAQGGVVYTAPERPVESTEAAELPPTPAQRGLDFLGSWLQNYLALLIFGLVVALVAPRLAGQARQNLDARKLPSTGVGCLTLILAAAGVVALVFAMILGILFVSAIKLGNLVAPILSASLLGFSILTFGTYLLTWVAAVLVGWWLGRWILRRVAPERADNRYLAMGIGLLIYALLMSLPIVGGLLGFLGVLLGLGAMVLLLSPYFLGMRMAPAEAEAAD